MPKFVKSDISLGRGKDDQIRDLITPDKRVGKLVPIDEVFPNPNQPRKHFDETSLNELAESIRQHGLINPITVNDQGVILAGERRYRACLKLGLREVPVVRMNGSYEISLVENLQREDLHPLEEARGYQLLVDAGHTHEQIAQRIGKDRSVVSHSLRLLELPPAIQAECVTSHTVTKDQLLQVLSGETDAHRWELWEHIKAGKSARAIRRERRRRGEGRPLTARMFINRVKAIYVNAESVDVSQATPKQRERLKANLSRTIAALQAVLRKLDETSA
jgi:ParB family chromosome partitioning protein